MKLRVIALGAALVGACDLNTPDDRLHDVAPTDGAPADTARDASGDVLLPIDAPTTRGWSAACGRELLGPLDGAYTLSTETQTDDAPRCEGLATAGPVQWIPMRVGPRGSAVVRVRPEGGGALPTVRVVTTCGGACVPLQTRRDDDGTLLVWWTNPGSDARTFQVAVGAEQADTRGRFSVWPRIGPTGTHATCATAEPLTPRTDASFFELGDEPGTCNVRRAPTNWYAVALDTGSTLSVSARASVERAGAMSSPVDLQLVGACGGPCITATPRALTWTSPFNVGIVSALTRHDMSCPLDTADGLVS